MVMNLKSSPRFFVIAVAVGLFIGEQWDGRVAMAGKSSSLMDISADGKLLVCTNRDNGTASVIDLQSHKKLREIPLGAKPEGVTFLGDSHTAAAAVYAEDKIVFFDADSGKKNGAIDVFDEPYGIVSDSSGSKVFVTLDYPGQIVEIDVKTRKAIRTFRAGGFPRGLALSADDRHLYVTEFYTGLVRAIDARTGMQTDQWAGASTDNLARQIVLHPTRPKAYLPHIRSRITAVHGEGSIFPYISVIDTDKKEGRRRKRIPMDAFLNNLVTANPWDVAISPDGKQLYAVFSGTNDLFACHILDDNYREINYRGRLILGNNPRAVHVSSDSKTFYVYNALDFNVVAYNAENLRPITTIPVCENPLDEEIFRGKILFYSALQPMVGRRWISCSSCHPDGDPDGRTWHNPEGLRNTQSLAGMAWTHPIHWSADRDEVQDFEHTIRGQLMQGRGLIRGTVHPSLETPNKGLSKDLDALSAYTNSHKFTLSPYAKKGLSESARRGKTIFFSKETGCAYCHSRPYYTDSQPVDDPNTIVRHDVGTGNDDESEKMGPAYDTPTLLGVYRTAPYLHHGKAETLQDVLTQHNQEDKHGSTSHLTSQQISDLVEFLKALPYEDPQTKAPAAGLKKVTR
jgi:YVTN family beta-propeller protein